MQRQHKSESDSAFPPKLVAAFRALPRQEIFIPPAIDARVRSAARRQLATWRRSGWSIPWPWALRWLAPALALLVLAGSAGFWFSYRTQTRLRSALGAEDINRDGHLDVLDALQLAHQLQQGQSSSAWDFNRDGAVDQLDARALAQRAVQLPKKARS